MRINGKQAELGAHLEIDDRVTFDRRRYKVASEQAAHQTMIYHKPEGQVTTRSDPEGRATVFEKLPAPRQGRWISIGRLDLNTSGLLLLTTDGELANRMMHPSGRIDREYLCRVRGSVADADLTRLLEGVQLEDGQAAFSDLVIGEMTAGHTWYTVTIMEGRKREVRRLWEAVGAQVARLKRVRFGPVFLPKNLRRGQFRMLGSNDHRVLREDCGLNRKATSLTLIPER